jgi:hypothetical protein
MTLFTGATDFAFLGVNDREMFLLHQAARSYWQRYYGAEETGSGDTSVAATRTLTAAGEDFSTRVAGERLRILAGVDAGDYNIVTLAPGGDVTKLIVDRDFPVGGQVNVSFAVQHTDLYGDSLPLAGAMYVKRATDVPFIGVYSPPQQMLTDIGYMEPADVVCEFSRSLHAVAPYDFQPAPGDMWVGPDGLVYELATLKPWDYFGPDGGQYLHWIATGTKTHRLLTDEFPEGAIPVPGALAADSAVNPEVVNFVIGAGQVEFVLPLQGIRRDRDGDMLIRVTYRGIEQDLGIDYRVEGDELTLTWISDVGLLVGDTLKVLYYPA